MVLHAEVTKKSVEETERAATDGAYISGLFLDGARWDAYSGALDVPPVSVSVRDAFAPMPVLHVRAVATTAVPTTNDTYTCPVYMTPQRGALTYVFFVPLRSKVNPASWVSAGVALLMDKP